ncbi:MULTISPECIES: peptide ABC transporter substrate-binding protein [Paenibacillus]|uniref:peptide ABC transporter substrate-binding protein n=1 Tax=Paenibacillus TaxID=44249 RepID=UPI0022B91A6E|nr:peptide ABC transporter substrate-binding protein [Paenibacillus caseinilyticus]MCZ8521229.1 peptide ABC transporter substrate-binding protein [Paenibacillus caseinilyticus]
MKLRKWLSTTVVLSLACALAAGCSGSTAPSQTDTATPEGKETAAPKQQISGNYRAEPGALDVSKTTQIAAFTILNAVGEGLYRLDKNNKAQPGLASGMPKISEDGRTYTITLKDNITYSDGVPVKAQDFVYSYQRSVDPATKAIYAFMVAWVKGGTDVMKSKTPEEAEAKKKEMGVKALDDKTLQITLERPIPFFTEQLSFLNFFPQRQDLIDKFKEKNGADAESVIGAGPFKLEKWDHDQQLVLVKNDKYWDKDSVKLERIQLNIVKDENTGLNLFQTGQSDLQTVTGENIRQWEGKPEYVLQPELSSWFIKLSEKNVPAFRNKKIRQALAMSIDNTAFIETVMGKGPVAATGFVPVGTSDGTGEEFRKKAGSIMPKFDPAKAKQLLQEGLQEAGLSAMPSFKLQCDDHNTGPKALEFLVAQWKQNLGIDVIAEPLPHKLRVDNENNHKYQASVSGWGADYNDPMTFLDMFITGSELNDVDWSNAEYDKFANGAIAELDKAKRSDLMVQAEKLLIEEMPIVPNYFRATSWVKNPKIQDLLFPAYGVELEFKWASVK